MRASKNIIKLLGWGHNGIDFFEHEILATGFSVPLKMPRN